MAGSSPFIVQIGTLTFLHYDFYAQVLAKIERGHETDLSDVNQFLKVRLVNPQKLTELFDQIEDQLFKYPAINSAAFRSAVELVVARAGEA